MWAVKSSHYPLMDQWISVRADACVTHTGIELAPYYTLEYPDFVHVLAVTSDHKLVLTRQYRHGFGATVIELPGGMAEASDDTVIATGLRELREETGFTSEKAVAMRPLSVDPAKFRNRLHLVVALEAIRTDVCKLDAGEDIEVIQASVAECLGMVQDGRFPNAAHIGMLLMGLHYADLLNIKDWSGWAWSKPL